MSSSQKLVIPTEQPTKRGKSNGASISQIWQGGGNLQDLQIDNRYRLKSGVVPQTSIDWDNTEIGIDNNFELNL